MQISLKKEISVFEIEISAFKYIYLRFRYRYLFKIIQISVFQIEIYRRLSLSQSPGYQTKYFEISVV